MNSPKRAKPDVVTYGDHELITPDTGLRKLVRQQPRRRHPVARAEAALARFPASSRPGCTTNASASTQRASATRLKCLNKATQKEHCSAPEQDRPDVAGARDRQRANRPN